jgi:hypothetical protein
MLEGSCLCGAIRYQVAGFMLDCHACYCRSCKKFSGTAHSTVMIGLVLSIGRRNTLLCEDEQRSVAHEEKDEVPLF